MASPLVTTLGIFDDASGGLKKAVDEREDAVIALGL